MPCRSIGKLTIPPVPKRRDYASCDTSITGLLQRCADESHVIPSRATTVATAAAICQYKLGSLHGMLSCTHTRRWWYRYTMMWLCC